MRHFFQSCLLCILAACPAMAQIGFGTASPNSMLDVRGGLAINPQVFTTNTTADINQQTFVFTGTAAATLTLPDATLCRGRIYWIKNASTTSPVPLVTIQPFGSQTIGGFTSAALGEPYEVTKIVSDGANWQVMSENTPVRKSSTLGGGWYEGGNTLGSLKYLGTITNMDMAFMTNNIERMRASTGGFWGIGTTTPTARLHLVNDNDDVGNEYEFTDYGTTITAGIYLRKHRGTVASPLDLQNGDLIAQYRFVPRYNGSVTRNDGSGLDGYYIGDGTNNLTDLRFSTSGSERMRINSDGNAAIGATSFNSTNPERLLVDAGATTSYNVISGKGSIDNYLQLNIRNLSGSSNASSDIVATADNGDESTNFIDLGINSGGYSNTTYPILSGINIAYLYCTGADFVMGNGSAGYDLVFFTNGYATTNERMRITAAGNVGVGATPGASDKLTVGGIVSPASDNSYTVGKSGATWSAVWAVNGAIQTSDARLKTSIQPLVCNMQLLSQLNAVQYYWKQYPAGNHKIGLIAQEVQKAIPEAVVGNESKEYLGLDYSMLVPVLINLLQQQQQRLASLKKELDSMEQPVKQ